MACEKCWGDAYLRHIQNPSKSQSKHYRELLEERKDNPCTLAEQDGQFVREGSGSGEAKQGGARYAPVTAEMMWDAAEGFPRDWKAQAEFINNSINSQLQSSNAGAQWIETEMWNFVHGAAMNLGLPESAEKRLHHEMKVVITAHQNVRASHAAQGDSNGN